VTLGSTIRKKKVHKRQNYSSLAKAARNSRRGRMVLQGSWRLERGVMAGVPGRVGVMGFPVMFTYRSSWHSRWFKPQTHQNKKYGISTLWDIFSQKRY
jgi:hypothetical protein